MPLNLSKEFIYRFLSALVAIPLVLYITFLGFPFFHILIAAFLFIACFEWNRMTALTLSCLIKAPLVPIAGYSYIFAAFYAMIKLYDSKGSFFFFAIFCLVWSADIGAYFVGKALKGPKLAPRLSPNKTWSGFIGGALVSYITTTIAITYFEINIPSLLLMALILLSHAGDLLESIVKRYYNVKDSGAIIPGHGGILDRLDSLMLVSIGAYIALSWSLL